jgi:uncharacterized membrane protein
VNASGVEGATETDRGSEGSAEPGSTAERGTTVDPLVAWVAAAVGATVVVAGAALLRPRAVVEELLWREFVGPLQASSFAAQCAIAEGGGFRFRAAGSDACAAALAEGRLVAAAEPTTTATVGYALALVFLAAGGALSLRRLGLCRGRRFFYGVLPFLALGGALLAVRDAAAALPNGPSGMVGHPTGLLLTWPAVYAVALLVTVGALAVGAVLAGRGLVERYEHVSTTAAIVLFGLAVGGLIAVASRIGGAELRLAGVPALLVGTTLLASALWIGVARVTPGVVERIGSMGLVVLWAYVLHGLAVVVATDWAAPLGFAPTAADGLVRVVSELTAGTLPASVAAATGTTWPFVPLQAAVALLVAASFERELVREDELALLLLVAVLGVALVPAVQRLLLLAVGL